MAPTESYSTLDSDSQYTTRTRAQPSSPPKIDHLSTMAQSNQPHTPSQTTHDTDAMDPPSRFTSINRPPREVEPTGSESQSAQDAVPYYPITSPTSSGSYKIHLSKLGFKQEEAELGTHHTLIKALRAYLEGIEYFYLRKSDNPAAFRTLVLRFLKEQGPRYWGPSNRQHLKEEELSKGYLYPRDVQRDDSLFLIAVEALFNYKAICNHNNDKKHAPENQMHQHIDFAAMTGRKADARALSNIKNFARSTSNSKPSPGPSGNLKNARPKKRQRKTRNPEDATDYGWNIFDYVETDSVLRPNPPRTKWTRESLNRTEAQDDDVQPAERAGRPKKEGRRRRSNFNHRTSQKLTTPNLHPRTPKNLHTGSSTDSDIPLMQSRTTKRHRPSPPATRDQSLANVQTPSGAPGRVAGPLIVSLVSDSDEGEPKKIKSEPLSASARAVTLLKVSMHNQPEKLEISVPLGACRTSNELFDKLTTEWRLRPEIATKVNFISATYRWSGEGHGMRRGEAPDWELFCTTIREACDNKEGDIKDRCVVEMKLIADD